MTLPQIAEPGNSLKLAAPDFGDTSSCRVLVRRTQPSADLSCFRRSPISPRSVAPYPTPCRDGSVDRIAPKDGLVQVFLDAHGSAAFRRQTAGTANALMSSFRLGNGLSDFGTAVGALVDKVDPRLAPMWLDLPHEHREYSYTAGADDRCGLSFVVLDVGWHVGSPSQRKHVDLNPKLTYRVGRMPIINSCERKRNGRAILLHVTLW